MRRFEVIVAPAELAREYGFTDLDGTQPGRLAPHVTSSTAPAALHGFCCLAAHMLSTRFG